MLEFLKQNFELMRKVKNLNLARMDVRCRAVVWSPKIGYKLMLESGASVARVWRAVFEVCGLFPSTAFNVLWNKVGGHQVWCLQTRLQLQREELLAEDNLVCVNILGLKRSFAVGEIENPLAKEALRIT